MVENISQKAVQNVVQVLVTSVCMSFGQNQALEKSHYSPPQFLLGLKLSFFELSPCSWKMISFSCYLCFVMWSYSHRKWRWKHPLQSSRMPSMQSFGCFCSFRLCSKSLLSFQCALFTRLDLVIHYSSVPPSFIISRMISRIECACTFKNHHKLWVHRRLLLGSLFGFLFYAFWWWRTFCEFSNKKLFCNKIYM